MTSCRSCRSFQVFRECPKRWNWLDLSRRCISCIRCAIVDLAPCRCLLSMWSMVLMWTEWVFREYQASRFDTLGSCQSYQSTYRSVWISHFQRYVHTVPNCPVYPRYQKSLFLPLISVLQRNCQIDLPSHCIRYLTCPPKHPTYCLNNNVLATIRHDNHSIIITHIPTYGTQWQALQRTRELHRYSHSLCLDQD